MKTTILGLATLGVLLFSTGMVAQSLQPATKEFSWHAGLVSLDENARTVTVKASTVSDRVAKDFEPVKAGERIMLRWSGFHDFADSIAQALQATEFSKAEDWFTFPAEFVAFDATNRFVTFKVSIPEVSIAKLKSLKPGDWVTATSPHGPSAKTTPITAIRPYGPSEATGNAS
jgi:hypothetical protein